MFAFVAVGCTPSNTPFERAIDQSRKMNVDHVEAAGQGLPFFSSETLNPIWQVTPETKRVRMPAFSLIDQNGKPRTESLFNGKISFVAFAFTSCSGFCEPMLRNLNRAAKQVSRQKNAQFVVISVDPENDTPDVLRAFARKINTDSRWIYLTGDSKTIQALARDTFASPLKKKKDPNDIVHSDHFYVIDGNRYLRGILNGIHRNLSDQVATVLGKS